jgi:4-hydroxybenzoyl-CoA reductase subunit alpha
VAAICVAEVLGIDVGRVRVYSSNSDTAPVDLGSYSSRVTFMMGNAARKAAEEVAKELRQAASDLTGYPPDQFHFEREHVICRANPDARVTFDQAVRRALAGKGAIAARGCFTQTAIGGKFKGATAGLAPAYSMSAYVAEVDVDLDTGWWRCSKVWAAHDCGKALNPLAVEGQIQGSIHMGLGQVQSESIEYQFGNMRNPNLLEYKIPTSLEMPEVEVIIVESNDAEGPFGAKEAGEGPLLPILPAVLNALYDAVGVRLYELPATQDKVWAAMRRAGGPKKPAPIAVAAPPKPQARAGVRP